MHNFEGGGWKKLDFIPRNLVKMIGGNVNKGRNESTKTNFSPVWLLWCLPPQHSHWRERNFLLFFHCHQWTFTRFGGWKVDFFPISTGFFCINSSLQKYASTGSKYLYGSQLVGWFSRLLSKAELLCVKGVNLSILAIFKGFWHPQVV